MKCLIVLVAFLVASVGKWCSLVFLNLIVTKTLWNLAYTNAINCYYCANCPVPFAYPAPGVTYVTVNTGFCAVSSLSLWATMTIIDSSPHWHCCILETKLFIRSRCSIQSRGCWTRPLRGDWMPMGLRFHGSSSLHLLLQQQLLQRQHVNKGQAICGVLRENKSFFVNN